MGSRGEEVGVQAGKLACEEGTRESVGFLCAGGVTRQKGKRQWAVEKVGKGDEGDCRGWESEEK